MRARIDVKFERSLGRFIRVLNQWLGRDNASGAHVDRHGFKRRMDGTRPCNLGSEDLGGDTGGDRKRLRRRRCLEASPVVVPLVIFRKGDGVVVEGFSERRRSDKQARSEEKFRI